MATLEQRSSRGAFVAFALVMLVVSVFSVACQRDAAPAAHSMNSEGKETRTISVPVEGMSCVVCAARVRKTLKAIDGVHDVHVDLEKRSARIEYEDSKVVRNVSTILRHLLVEFSVVPGYSEGRVWKVGL